MSLVNDNAKLPELAFKREKWDAEVSLRNREIVSKSENKTQRIATLSSVSGNTADRVGRIRLF